MSSTIAFFTDPTLAAAGPRVRYVLDALERHPLAPDGMVCLLNPSEMPPDSAVCFYGKRENAPADAVFIPAQEYFFCLQPVDNKQFTINRFQHEKGDVFAVERESHSAGQPFFSDQSFSFDWLETLFFHFSRWEEYAPGSSDLDETGLMKSDAQLLVRYLLHHIPVADRLIAAVFSVLGFKSHIRPTVFSLSHDVDDLEVFGPGFRLLRYLGGVALRNKSIRRWPTIISDYWKVRRGKAKDPGDTFDLLFRLGPEVERTIYFGMGNSSSYDHFPALDTPRLLEIRAQALDAGYAAGIHPSFNTWKNVELLQQECQRAAAWLSFPITRSRQHYLHFSFPETADALETAGIEEDATLGFRDKIGFRAGTGFPFQLYHFQEERPYRWVEKPLVAMDCGLVREGHSSPEKVRQIWRAFISENAEGTAISLNLHNTYVYEQALHGIDFAVLFGQILQNAKGLHRNT